MSYPGFDFSDWLNDIPDSLGEYDTISFEELGLREDAPTSAVDAYKKYLSDVREAKKDGVKL